MDAEANMRDNELRILFIGDICADAGVDAVMEYLPRVKTAYGVDFCVANAENSSSRGVGLSRRSYDALTSCGVDVVTLGNHAWQDKDAQKLMNEGARVVRPANFPPDNPGKGSICVKTAKGRIGVVNLIGQVFMGAADCPFRALDRELEKIGELGGLGGAIVVDIHAEATSEKCAIAYHADGRASFVAGTHTHVQTADERVLSCGAAFITDVGMTGPCEGVIGVDRSVSLRRFRTHMPTYFQPARGAVQFAAALATIDVSSGKAISITRLREPVR